MRKFATATDSGIQEDLPSGVTGLFQQVVINRKHRSFPDLLLQGHFEREAMKNILLLSAVLFALSQVNILVEADQAMYIDGMFLVMGAEPNVEKLVGLHLSMVPFTLAVMVILCVLAAYAMEVIEKK